MNKPMSTHRPKARPGTNPLRGKPQGKKQSEEKDTRVSGKSEAFRVLIAVHRPRYRARAERAVDLPGWEMRSLLIKEDPIGLLNQKPPHLVIMSDTFGRSKSLAFLKAAQKYRSDKTRIIGLFEDEEVAEEGAVLCDAALIPPWKTAELRTLAAQIYTAMRGASPEMPAVSANDESEDEE